MRHKNYLETVHAAKIGVISRIISSPPLLKVTASLQFWSSCLNGKRMKRMKHLNQLSCPTGVRIRARAPLQAPEELHLRPPGEAGPAGAVGSPALTGALAAVQTREVLTALLGRERPPGKATNSLGTGGFGGR